MTTRDRLNTVLSGGTPDGTPLSIYSGVFDDPKSDRWRRLFAQGLGCCYHCSSVRHVEHEVRDTCEDRIDGDRHYRLYRKETPVGTLQRVTLNGWHHEDWIKTPKDYAIRRWIVEHTELVPQYEVFAESEEAAGDYGLTLVTGSRSPAMSINIDWAGTAQFCMDLALGVDELFELYQAQKKQFIEETRLIAAGQGRFVVWFENVTVSMLGPRWYRELLVPVYEEAVPILVAAGKRALVHYDGALRVIADQIAAAPFHVIESLTEPPEGDLLYDQCRALWPDKVFWGNVNVGLCYGCEKELREGIIGKRERAGKRGFALEISEDLPANWQTCIPVILRTLEELG